MIAICYECGAAKQDPLSGCDACHTVPILDEDLALSLMLSEQFLSREKLVEASRAIAAGQKIALPPHVRAAMLAAIQTARLGERGAARSRRVSRAILFSIGVGVLLLIGFLHPYPHFQVASYQDRVDAYQSFLNRFPKSDYSAAVKERIRVLREPIVWNDSLRDDRISSFRSYVKVYPDGRHLEEARRHIVRIADAQWVSIAESRSEREIKKFIHDFPESTKIAAAEGRIQQLYNDFGWVKEQDLLDNYRHFAARNPSHPQSTWVEKRIIDLEVAEIAAGHHGQLPAAVPIGDRLPSSISELEIENGTGYELTIRYSGTSSYKVVIANGIKQKLALVPGTYKVAASVDASNVLPYYGTENLAEQGYSVRYYIERQRR
jgi:hypothetical protein